MKINIHTKVKFIFLAFLMFSKFSFSQSEIESEEGDPQQRAEEELMKTVDPKLGYSPTERLVMANQSAKNIFQTSNKTSAAIANLNWIERGPSNVGGRTRALMFDPNDNTHKKVWAGGVTGGLWYNNDITNANSSWVKVDDFWSNISITSIAADPTNPQIFYVGTGERYGSNNKGAGIFKTINGGISWAQLAATTSFYYINDLAVRNESGSGVLYAGCHSNGLQRSTDGGTTFNQVLPDAPGPSTYAPRDIEIAADNRIYIGTRKNDSPGTGGGTILFSDNGTFWTVSTHTVYPTTEVELASAPSDANTIYAVITKNTSGACTFAQSHDKGLTWKDTIIPDITYGQSYYDLALAVDPLNASVVIAGTQDFTMSTNKGLTWSSLSFTGDIHMDHHAFIFAPGDNQKVLFGNDGGVYYLSGGISLTDNNFMVRNKDYNVTQFNACAAHPTAGTTFFLAGAQDNGTQAFSSNGINATNMVVGSDGGSCFIDEDSPQYQVVNTFSNNYVLSSNSGQSFDKTISTGFQGVLVNPTDYDSRENILYSCFGTNKIQRIANITSTTPSTAENISINLGGTYSSVIRVSPYSAAGTTTLFVGTGILTGSTGIFKVTNAQGTAVSTNITGNIPILAGVSISCIEIGASELDLLVTITNYGVVSVWQTSDGGIVWNNKEGNLPDMPIRWAIYNPENRNQVLLATESGVWSTDNISVTTPDWQPSNSGLANVRVNMLRYRKSDKLVLAATYGRGLFTSNVFAPADVVAPTVDIYLPTNNATNVSKTTTLTLTFNEEIQKGTGNIIIKENGTQTQSIPVTGTNVTISGNTLTIIPSSAFTEGVNVNVEMAAGVIKDMANNNYAGITNATTWAFTISATADLTPPTVSLYAPLNNAVNVSKTTTLALNFSETVQKGTGNIIIKENGTQTQTIPVTGTNVTISGSTLTIIPSSAFTEGVNVNIEMAAGVIKDMSNNNYAGITNATTWAFTISSAADLTPPTVSLFTPLNNAINISNTSPIVLTFSEAVKTGTGNIIIKENGTVKQTIPITGTNVTISGSTVTIDPTDFGGLVTVNVEMASGVIKDMSNNNYAGLTGATAWSFKTHEAIGIFNIDEEKYYSVYPNPNPGVFNLAFEEANSSSINVKVINMKGQVIHEQLCFTFKDGSYLEKIDLGEPIPGIYIIKVESENSLHVLKMSVIKY